MAVIITMNMPATIEQYQAVNDAMEVGGDRPAGLIVHTAEQTDSGLRIVDVWESADAFSTFSQTRLGPAVAQVLGAGAPPDIDVRELHNVIT